MFSCDDFWHGANVHLYGFWAAQKWYWVNWEGSFIHTFLATIPHIFVSMNIVPLFNIAMLVLFIFSVFYFIRVFGVLPKLKSLFIALYLVVIVYSLTRGSSELRFWLSANVPYMFGVSSCLLLVSLFHNTNCLTVFSRSLALILCCLIVDNKITYILFICFCLLIHLLIYNQKKNLIFIFTAIILFSLFNVFAPGNMVRLNENVAQMSIEYLDMIKCVGSRVSTVLSSLPVMMLLLFVLLPEKASPLSISYSRILLIALVTIAFIVLDSVVMLMCFHDSGPIRTYILPELSVMFLSWLLIRKIYFNINFEMLPFIKKGFVIVALVWLASLQISELLKLDETMLYSEKARIRNRILEASRKGDFVVLDMLPSSGLLNSYFANDDVWLQNVYLPYFNKATQCAIKESEE